MPKCMEMIDTTRDDNMNKLRKITDKWYDNKIIDALTGGNENDFKRFYADALPHLDFDLSRPPTARELKTLDRTMDKYLGDLKKSPWKIGKLFKLPEAIMKKNPVTRKYFDDLVRASNFYRGDMHNITADMKKIGELLNTASGNNGIMARRGVARGVATKEIRKREDTYNKLMAEGHYDKADKFYAEELKDLYKDGELKALQSLYDLMLDPRLVSKQQIKDSELKYGPQIVDAAKMWHNPVPIIKGGKRVEVEDSLKERLWNRLGNGLLDNISMLKNKQTENNKDIIQVEKLQKLYDDYFKPERRDKNGKVISKGAPKKVKNYFPRQVLDIAPTFAKLSEDIWSSKIEKNPKEVGDYINRMIEDITTNLERPGSLFERAEDAPTRVSKDVLGILDHYAKTTMRFNHNARVSRITTEALQKLLKLEGKGFDEHVLFLKNYIESTHNAVLGIDRRNSKLTEIARTITAYQFISKLGLNIRSAARNATQSLQNWVYFGTKGIVESMSDMNTPRLKRIVNEEMGKHGFEFINIQEFAMPKDLLQNVKLDDTGKVVESGPHLYTKINSWFEDIARITGKPMQWVENHVNRGLTFKIGFLQEYRRLTGEAGSALIRRSIARRRKDWSKLGETEQLELIEREAISKASNKAADYVKDLHYLYDPWAKPKVLQNPVGAVLGQFSTYSINFFEYQRKIAAAGGSDLLAAEWNTPAAWRLYRLGMLYTFVTGLSAVTNTKWGNLIENDTWERIKQIDQYYGGTKADKEKAFFGKRPATAIFGGPFVSDIIKIGQLMNFSKMNSNEFSDYTSSYKEFSDRTGKLSEVEEFIRLINTGAGRALFTTVPNMINGASFPTVIGQELGLYQTHDYQGLKDKMLYPFQEHLPKKQAAYFKPDKPAKRNPKYTEEELHMILYALQQAQTNK